MTFGPDRFSNQPPNIDARAADKEWSPSGLLELGFRPFATCKGKDLAVETKLPMTPAIYIAVLNGIVFWVGETSKLRSRFQQYRRWFALPDDDPRKDRKTRDKLLEMTGGEELTFYYKDPMQIYSELTSKLYPAHRLEETILLDYFRPVWNFRKGGRRNG